MGFLVFVPEVFQLGKIQTLHVIDGQQRLTTLSLLLIALRDAARENGLKDLASEITDCYLVHPHKQGNERFRVFLKLRDRQEYHAVLLGEPAARGRITAALSFFGHKLSELPEVTDDRGLKSFLALVTRRLQFMCATLEDDNPYNIFKSLNSTGVPLSAADLIRNFVFMHLRPEEHDEFDAHLWTPLEGRFTRKNGILDGETLSAFMRDFLMRDGRYVEETSTFETFEDRYTAMGFSPNSLAADLNRFADYYLVIRGERFDRSENVTTAMNQLNALKSSTTYPLLLHLFDQRAQGVISDAQLAEAIQLLVGFILRRFVCGVSSRGYGQTFVKACALLGASPVDGLRGCLLSKEHPDDARFKLAFVRFNLYGSAYGRFILESLEAARGHREPADLSEAQVEHIMPQTLSHEWRHDLGADADRIFATWLHTPGNLTLSAYNQELWNRPFAEKRSECGRSNIGMTRELARLEHWGEAEIGLRGEAMAEMAARIWVGPKEPAAAISAVGTPNGQDPTVRELDPEGPPSLFHTQIIDGCFGTTSVSNWKQLVECAMRTALQAGVPFAVLTGIANVREVDPQDRSYHQVEGTNVWLQGMDANQCWRRSLRLAQITKTDIKLHFRWPHAAGAAQPGVEAVLRWPPSHRM